jgi:hypothetical protein
MALRTFVAVAAWCVIGIVETSVAQDAVQAPAFKVGDRHTYTRFDRMNAAAGTIKVTETVTVVSDTAIETSVENQPGQAAQHRYTRERNPVRVFGFEFDPLIPIYSFPLSVGKEWSGRYSFFSPQINERINAMQQVRVEGWEEIKVPAGTFKALKFSITRDLTGSRGMRRFQLTWWYSPEARHFARVEIKSPGFQDETVELIEYALAQ